jgi:predicted homoserine dehydrogenase-like protein
VYAAAGVQVVSAGGGRDTEQNINANGDNADDESQFMEKMKAQMREKRRKLDTSSSSKMTAGSSTSGSAAVAEEITKQNEQATTTADNSKGFDHEKDAVATLRQAKDDAVKAKAKEYGEHYTLPQHANSRVMFLAFCSS